MQPYPPLCDVRYVAVCLLPLLLLLLSLLWILLVISLVVIIVSIAVVIVPECLWFMFFSCCSSLVVITSTDAVFSGSYVAQYEHTLLLRPTRKEVLSRGDDF